MSSSHDHSNRANTGSPILTYPASISTFDPDDTYDFDPGTGDEYDYDTDRRMVGDVPLSVSPTSASRDGHLNRNRFSNGSNMNRDPQADQLGDAIQNSGSSSSASGRSRARWSDQYGRTDTAPVDTGGYAPSTHSLPARTNRDSRQDSSAYRSNVDATSAAMARLSTNDPTRMSYFPSPPRVDQSVSSTSSGNSGPAMYSNGEYDRPLPSPASSHPSRSPTVPVQGSGSRAMRPGQPTPRATYDSHMERAQQAAQAPPSTSQMPPLRVPFICVFTHQLNGEMYISAPEATQDRTPLYIVSVHMNCLIPTSYITTIRRGRAPQDIVGRFEMGISREEPTISMGSRMHLLKNVMGNYRKVPHGGKPWWTWKREGHHALNWDCRDEKMLLCEHADKQFPLARLIPASAQAPGNMAVRTPATMLEVNVNEPALVDEIVVSALVVERRRLSGGGPKVGSDKYDDIFNWARKE